jgi:uncharacterized protein
MSGERIFIDTWYVVALLNARDAYHRQAINLLPRVRSAAQLVTTEAVLVEICNGLASKNRSGATTFVKTCFSDPRFDIVAVDRALLDASLRYYDSTDDKEWGLTDCISFSVMRDRSIQLVATGDHHFRQAGFVPLIETVS